MPRPTTKQDLMQVGNEQYKKLWELINSMTDDEQSAVFLFEDRDKNLRDVLIHLYEWHQLLLNWVSSNKKGEEKAFLPEPYNWKTYPQMNIEFWNKNQSTSYVSAKAMLDESHKRVLNLIDSFTNEELFTKKYYSWTGTTNLGSYCISTTASHYDWAQKKIKNHIKTYRG